jgi:pfkB family carbohydrate kinase
MIQDIDRRMIISRFGRRELKNRNIIYTKFTEVGNIIVQFQAWTADINKPELYKFTSCGPRDLVSDSPHSATNSFTVAMSDELDSAKLNITIIGSLNVDFITRTTRVPKAGETLHGTSFEVKWGGKGANQAVAAGRLSRENADDGNATANVKMVGMVGDDIYGSQMIDSLKRSGIDTSAICIRKGEMTGIASIWVDETDGQNRIVVVGGANNHLQTEDDPARFTAQPAFDGYGDIAIFQLENPVEIVLGRIKAAHDQHAMASSLLSTWTCLTGYRSYSTPHQPLHYIQTCTAV